MLSVLHNVERAFPEPPHMQQGTAAVWFTRPAGIVVQLLEPTRITLPISEWLIGPAYAELERRHPAHPFTIVMDFHFMLSRTLAARTAFLSQARRVGKRFGAGYWVPPRVQSPAAARSAEASIALMRAIGIDVHVVGSAAEAIAHAGLSYVP
jgi:hypothetical protein